MDIDSGAFESGLEGAVRQIRAGIRREEARLASVVVRGAFEPVDQGELASSGYSTSDGEYGWTSRHAAYVEYGTEDTRAQPFARPSIARTAAQLRSPI
jgi:hypothetical protein